VLPWALLVAGSVASLAANVAVAQPTVVGRVIAAWPSFALIGAYEMLMRQIRSSAVASTKQQPRQARPHTSSQESGIRLSGARRRAALGPAGVSSALVAWVRSFSSRRGIGRWPIRRVMARFLAGGRSPISTVVMSGGAAW
jgi:hypothetical protein